MADAPAINIGVIQTGGKAAKRKASSNRTILVTGIARSGTSMVAAVLRAAGLHMGDFVHDVVHEDGQMQEILQSRDTAMLRRLIGQRNTQHKQWGFKLPSLHTLMRHDEVGLFRNPHLIAIYRDPVAVAVRHAISEHADAAAGLANTIGAMAALARFAEQAGCPTLFLSYEKVLSFPPLLVDSVLDFCGIAASAEQRGTLLAHVEPNNPAYMAAASRRFMGRIDGIMDGELFGWCFEEGRLEPVTLEVYADDRLTETFVADGYRGDLAAGGIGNGLHGFSCDLSHHKLRPDAAIRVRIKGRNLDLENSGTALNQFAVSASAS